MSFAPFSSTQSQPRSQPQFQQSQPFQQQPFQQRSQPQPQQRLQPRVQERLDLSKPIIFYSLYCKHSATFIDGLKKHPTLFKNFVKISIDPDARTKQRPKIFYDIQLQTQHRITSVPTIVVEDGQYILTDKEAFKWLQFNLTKDKETIQGFNEDEMNRFSDQYADFGATNIMDDDHVKHQRFKFLNEDLERIPTPGEGDPRYNRQESTVKSQRNEINSMLEQNQRRMGKLDLSDDYSKGGISQVDISKLEAQRGYSGNGSTMKHKDIDFTNPNLGYAAQAMRTGSVQMSPKEAEMDMRMEQIKLERDAIVSPVQRENVKIDWQTGEYIV